MSEAQLQRATLLHFARVALTEARRRRHQRGFAAFLLTTCAKSRRLAAQIDLTPAQGELFG